MHAGAIGAAAITAYPVVSDSGTALGLKVLYGLEGRSVSEEMLSELLIHLYFRLQRSRAFRAKADSLATLSLNLCGWHW